MTERGNRTFSRRGFARVVAGSSLIVGFDAMTGSWVSAADAQGTPFASLPHLDGALSFDPTTRNEYAKDYGQIVHQQPLAVLRPGSVEDIARTVAFARRFGLKIAARGEGHQPFGQAQVCGGIVIDMRSLQQVHTFTADSVEFDAGASWRTVLQATLSYGLTPRVITKFLGLTVGGTIDRWRRSRIAAARRTSRSSARTAGSSPAPAIRFVSTSCHTRICRRSSRTARV
jgi:hypothetical protein